MLRSPRGRTLLLSLSALTMAAALGAGIALAPISASASTMAANGRTTVSAGQTGVVPDSHISGNFLTRTITNLATGRCLDSNSGEQLYTLPCNGGNYQRWDGSWDPYWPRGGAYEISDHWTTYCLTNAGNSQPFTEQCALQDGYNKDYHITYGGTPGLQIRPDDLIGWAPGGGDYCLDSNANGDVYLNPCQNTNRYQNWVISGPGPSTTLIHR